MCMFIYICMYYSLKEEVSKQEGVVNVEQHMSSDSDDDGRPPEEDRPQAVQAGENEERSTDDAEEENHMETVT